MKSCPKCQQSYEEWIEFCFNDGSPLQSKAAPTAPAANDPFDVPEPRFISGTDVPEPVHLRPAPTPTPSSGEVTLPRYTRPQRNLPQVATPAPTAPIAFDASSETPIVTSPETAPAPVGEALPATPPVPVAATAAEASLEEDVFDGGWGTSAPEAPAPVVPSAAPSPASPSVPPKAAGGGSGGKVALAVIALCVVGGGAAALKLLGAGGGDVAAPPQELTHVTPEAPPPPATTSAPAPPPPPAEPPAPPPEEQVPAPEPSREEARAAVASTTPRAREETPRVREEAPRPADGAPGSKAAASARAEAAARAQAAAAPRPASTVSDSPWGVEAAPTVGTLRVRSEPAGAKVFVDNSERGRTPLDVELPYGSHNVRVAQRGYKPEVRDVSIRVRELTVPFTLRPELTTGQVTVYAPDAARISVDGNDVGVAPVSISLSEGMHNFRLAAGEKSCTVAREVKFSGGSSAKLTLTCP